MTDSLGDRMKLYENTWRQHLVPRMPIIVRVDGRAFHTLMPKINAEKPFDPKVTEAMNWTMVTIACEMQGCLMAYTQSDEISFVLQCDATHETQAWFGGNIQKIASVSASLAAMHFSREIGCGATFDARVFNLPWEEVPNYLLWRHKDWYRNSVSMAARAIYSHKECTDKSVSDLMGMLYKAGKPWQELSDRNKNGMFYSPIMSLNLNHRIDYEALNEALKDLRSERQTAI